MPKSPFINRVGSHYQIFRVMILQAIHKRVSNLSFMALLATVLMFVTYQAEARTLKVMSYSGEALFEGIFFSEGEVAEQIPELRGLSAKNFVKSEEERQEIDEFRAAVLTHVNKNHPKFLGELKAAVDSRSHVKIDKVITVGKSYVEEAVNSLSYERNTAAEDEFTANLNDKIDAGMSTDEVKSAISAEAEKMSRAIGEQACLAVAIALVLVLIKLLVIPFADDGQFYQEAMVNSISKL